jgi:hypothetical protein
MPHKPLSILANLTLDSLRMRERAKILLIRARIIPVQ